MIIIHDANYRKKHHLHGVLASVGLLHRDVAAKTPYISRLLGSDLRPSLQYSVGLSPNLLRWAQTIALNLD